MGGAGRKEEDSEEGRERRHFPFPLTLGGTEKIEEKPGHR